MRMMIGLSSMFERMGLGWDDENFESMGVWKHRSIESETRFFSLTLDNGTCKNDWVLQKQNKCMHRGSPLFGRNGMYLDPGNIKKWMHAKKADRKW